MALFEYFCDDCKLRYEKIVRFSESQEAPCPKCKGTHTHKLISRFAIAGQGDLRESTQHGCHDCDIGPSHEAGHSGDHRSHD